MKVEVDTIQLRALADAEFARARDRHAAELRTIERIEGQVGSRLTAGDAMGGEWNGIRNAIRACGKTATTMTAAETLKFITARYAGAPRLTEKQIAGALRKMTDVGELHRLSPATASKSAVYEIKRPADEEIVPNEKTPA